MVWQITEMFVFSFMSNDNFSHWEIITIPPYSHGCDTDRNHRESILVVNWDVSDQSNEMLHANFVSLGLHDLVDLRREDI